MAISSIETALAQYASNMSWDLSASSARAALEALRYLRLHRAMGAGHAGSNLNYEEISSEIGKIEGFLGITSAIAGGGNRPGLYKARRRNI